MAEISSYDAIIFDFDGTIVISEPLWHEYTPAIVQESLFVGLFNISAREIAEQCYGKSVAAMFDLFQSNYGDQEIWNSSATATTLIEDFERVGLEKIYSTVPLYPGVLDLIRQLHEMQLPIGIATNGNKKWVDVFLDRFDLHDVISVVLDPSDVSHGKPAPDLYLGVASRLLLDEENIDSRRFLVFEDSPSGMKGVKAAGMTLVAFMNESNQSNRTAIRELCDFEVSDWRTIQ